MSQRNRLSIRLAAMLFVILATVTAGANIGNAQTTTAGPRGCHAWAAVFRPVLGILGAGKVLVALPAHIPHFTHRVYAHANVLNPPLTFDVALSTKPGTGWPVPAGKTLLAVHGIAGMLPPPPGATTRVAGGKTLILPAGSSATRSVYWHDRAAGITYTVSLPARFGLPALLRVAGSLTPGALRRTPITAAPAAFNACP